MDRRGDEGAGDPQILQSVEVRAIFYSAAEEEGMGGEAGGLPEKDLIKPCRGPHPVQREEDDLFEGEGVQPPDQVEGRDPEGGVPGEDGPPE